MRMSILVAAVAALNFATDTAVAEGIASIPEGTVLRMMRGCDTEETGREVAQAYTERRIDDANSILMGPQCFSMNIDPKTHRPRGATCVVIKVLPEVYLDRAGYEARLIQCRLTNGDVNNWVIIAIPGMDT